MWSGSKAVDMAVALIEEGEDIERPVTTASGVYENAVVLAELLHHGTADGDRLRAAAARHIELSMRESINSTPSATPAAATQLRYRRSPV